MRRDSCTRTPAQRLPRRGPNIRARRSARDETRIILPSTATHSAQPATDTDHVVVRSRQELGQLIAEILSPERNHAVIGLTTRPGESEPAIAPGDVRSIVGPAPRIYVIPTGPLTRGLTRSLPARLDVCGGAARIWWPGINPHSDPLDHPLALCHPSTSPSHARAVVAEKYEDTRPLTRRREALLQRQRTLTQEHNRHLTDRLSRAEIERDQERVRADQAVAAHRQTQSGDLLALGRGPVDRR
jgi:hypothetical protein